MFCPPTPVRKNKIMVNTRICLNKTFQVFKKVLSHKSNAIKTGDLMSLSRS